MTRHLHIDAFSGIAGDMFLGALIDLGAELSAIERALSKLPVEQAFTLTADRVQRHGIGAVDFKVRLGDEHSHTHHHHHCHDDHHHDDHHGDQRTHLHDHSHDHHHDHPHSHGQSHTHDHHHHIGYRDIMQMVELLDLTAEWKKRAGRVVTLLAEAEARVHDKSLEDIHFHEVGAVDSIVDMLGSIVALSLLEIDTLSCGPLPISRGFVRCDHGLMPVPAPATAYLLENLPTLGVDRTGELVTPTGAALVAGLASTFGPPPAMTLRAVGYGAGDREDPNIPNLLRLMLGEITPASTLSGMPPAPAVAAAD